MAIVGAKSTTFQLEIATVLTDVAQVERIQCPQSTVETRRTRDLDSDYEGVNANGIVAGGTAAFTIWYDPTDDQHEALLSSVHDTSVAASARKKGFAAVFNQLSPVRTWAFDGVQESFNASAEAGEMLKAEGTIQVESSTTLPV